MSDAVEMQARSAKESIAGWYRDPAGGLRYWNDGWTAWVAGPERQMRQSPVSTENWPSPREGPAPPGAWWQERSRSRRRSTTSMTLSVGTLFAFLDIFAPFTAPFGIALAFSALRCAATDDDRRRAWQALALACATVLLWFLLIPAYDTMNNGM